MLSFHELLGYVGFTLFILGLNGSECIFYEKAKFTIELAYTI